MAQLLTCKSISKTYGSEALFEDFTISFEENCRTGIVGPNGTGKSTLLKIIAGIEEIDGGEISKKRGLQIAYVPQIKNYSPSDSVFSVLKASAVSSGQDEITAETNTAIISSILGFSSPDIKATDMSGGWQKRLTIAEQLVKQPDLLLLDEPTNHLDFEGLVWLESLLKNSEYSWVLITHDRYFLDRLASEIVEINPCFPDGYLKTEGGYQSHLTHKDDLFTAIESQTQTLSSKVRREVEWLQRGPKARTTKARFRVDQAHQLQNELYELRKLRRQKTTEIDFTSSDRKTKSLLSLKNASIGYDKPLYSKLDIELTKGSRVGILGPNGSGKSTLVKSLIGDLSLLSGDRKAAEGLSIVYFSQARDELDENHTLKRALGEGQDNVIFRDRPIHVVSWAKRFGFGAEDLSTQLKDLSGGQLARVHIALLMLKKADILFLDEPTNDLDLDTIEVMENSLSSFKGAIVVISHDRRFLENLCTNYVGLDGNSKHVKISSFGQWEKSLTKENKQNFSKKEKQQESKPKSKKVKLSYKDQYELDNIEGKIAEAEEYLEKAASEVESLATSTDHVALTEATDKMDKAQGEVDRLYARWDELEALKSSAE